MGRGGGGRGGGGGGGGGGIHVPRRLVGILPFLRPRMSSSTYTALNTVAVARGLGSVDDLMASLGRQGDHISNCEALELLKNELGVDALTDHAYSQIYSDPKGKECQKLLNRYMELMKSKRESDHVIAELKRRRLIQFCKYHEEGES